MGAGAEIFSIINPTLSSADMELDWRICRGQATGSDHELIKWELLGEAGSPEKTSGGMTGWDVSGWDPAGKEVVQPVQEVVDPGAQDLRKALGKARRTRRPNGMSRIQEARRELRRAIRKAKRDCRNRFLQESSGNGV